MGFDQVTAGKDVPNDVNVIIEISAQGEPIKFEVDKDSGCVFVDRFMGTSMRYPCNYGYVPHTVAGDGDPVDVLVVTPFPLQPGVVIRCRPVGVLKMEDESGEDAKVVAVPVSKLTPLYNKVETTDDLPELLMKQVVHFFEHYKDLEPGKWVKVTGWGTVEDARQEILTGIANAG
ncbi:MULTISPECIES: inorganic diphosphatase [Denitromonas]|jgi:inorganic pyrophosphatase|uniref:Inorganic pyrophosphatase n=2 Tax=Denitromonas TaxID=139331 RepID=A0A558DYQ0_9RHOO|nr:MULTISPECIES: inorganic diphosphatase [Denitromonas]TVO52277.1 inorganic diphosphatase [Denitromonas halophila]TVO60431.1 inorganic diphosphatase [Denitromonas ohlonensis]TVO78596.1 inorganic diphosphatase [Denitromonas ohlonensis]TVT46435.1 MAG: inorganic diphosphatase [Denitromonas halophila]TVT66196.1 MAG: inorganic diphosphatase [Denitromonas halophila]